MGGKKHYWWKLKQTHKISNRIYNKTKLIKPRYTNSFMWCREKLPVWTTVQRKTKVNSPQYTTLPNIHLHITATGAARPWNAEPRSSRSSVCADVKARGTLLDQQTVGDFHAPCASALGHSALLLYAVAALLQTLLLWLQNIFILQYHLIGLGGKKFHKVTCCSFSNLLWRRGRLHGCVLDRMHLFQCGCMRHLTD